MEINPTKHTNLLSRLKKKYSRSAKMIYILPNEKSLDGKIKIFTTI